MSEQTRVGCIGLGNMGAGMAESIARAGFRLSVYDVNAAAMQRFVAAGARASATPADLASQVDIVTLCVLNDQQVEEVLTGSDGVLSTLAPGGVIVIHSTASPATCQAMAVQAGKRGVHVVDAPISGGQGAAKDGTLTLMLGGPAAALEKCAGVFDAISAARFHVGGVGSGQVAKIVNNLMGIVNRIVIGEALTLARAAGLADEDVLEVVGCSTGNSWQVSQWRAMQAIAADSTTGALGMSLMSKKDLGLALALAQTLGVAVPITSVAALHTAQMFTEVG